MHYCGVACVPGWFVSVCLCPSLVMRVGGVGCHPGAGVYKCSLLCAAILGCKQVCSGVHVCVQVLCEMNFQNTFWRLDS